MDVTKLAAANLQVLSDSDSQYFSVNVNTGIIIVNDRIDREQLCGQSLRCFLHLKLAIENPVEFYRIEVEILDINDNAPAFASSTITLQIFELAALGARFPIPHAWDPDVGTNTLQTYHLSANEHFNLNVKARTDGTKFPELVLERALDREQVAVHSLVLTAEDGGLAPKSSSIRIAVHILDANDNHPVFDRPTYYTRLVENSPPGTLVMKLNATDLDEGSNGQIQYSLSSHNSEALRRIFAIDGLTGEVRVQGSLDFEEASVYEIEVEAKDQGSPPMEEHCSVTVEVVDVNDNAPEVILTSFSSSMSEDAPPGSVVAVIHVKDRDSGDLGKVQCDLPRNLPFKLRKDFEHQYSLLTSEQLDRESAAGYNITIKATDSGVPQKSTQKNILIQVSDVNDNAPTFSIPSYTAHVEENASPGTLVFSLSASDPDVGVNSKLSYSIVESSTQGLPISSYFHINQENGSLYTSRVLDYEQEKVFQVAVEVKDAGFPPLSSTATLHLFVLDQNDNAPVIVHPQVPKGSSFHQSVLLPMDPGHLVTKVVAVDADSGHNAWLSYRLLQEPGEAAAFKVERHSGEIRVSRALREPGMSHRLVVEVQDNGVPSLSASLVLVISAEDSAAQDFSRSLDHLPRSPSRAPNLTLFLVISLVAISLVSCVMLASTLNFCGRPSPEGFIRYLEVAGAGAPHYKSCLSPMSEQGDFFFVKPFARSTTAEK
uniref:Protocadherin gamma-C3 n=1 Tax=Varanus komodoensis TaxID=61221 RepID=A0A8D2LLT5_VARKO